jgi:hypothetical protein
MTVHVLLKQSWKTRQIILINDARTHVAEKWFQWACPVETRRNATLGAPARGASDFRSMEISVETRQTIQENGAKIS